MLLTLCTSAQHCMPQVIRSTMKRNISHIYSGTVDEAYLERLAVHLLSPALFLSLSFSLYHPLASGSRDSSFLLDCVTQCLLPDLTLSLPPCWSLSSSLSLPLALSHSLDPFLCWSTHTLEWAGEAVSATTNV